MKRLLGMGLGLLGVLVGIVLFRTFRLAADPPSGGEAPAVAFDGKAAVERLAAFVRLPTVSHKDPAQRDRKAFAAVPGFLARSYPRVHRALKREEVGESFLFTWEGTDSSLKPAIFLAHYDVVPVPQETLPKWTHPPFAGVVADGFVWGRGALDDKAGVLGLLEAADALLASGFRPRRTLMLAFGHDEEVGGPRGAKRIAELLASRRVEAEMVLDEGGFLVGGALPGVNRSIAFVGIAEKGYTSLTLTATAPGGHSSMPPSRTAIGRLARAVHRLETHPLPARLGDPTREMLLALAPELDFTRRLAIANLWLLERVLLGALSGVPALNASIRTTTAPTIFQAGLKDNVLPQVAKAVVNFRLLPGDTETSLKEHVRRTIDDAGITIEAESHGSPSPVSDPRHPTYALVKGAIEGRFADVRVAPYLTIAGTDTKHYTGLSRHIYRFLPIPLGNADLARIHGNDERVEVAGYLNGVRFYHDVMKRLGE